MMKFPSSPVKRIFLTLLILLIVLAVLMQISMGSVLNMILLPIAVVVGPFMAISYPFSWSFKLIYALGLILSTSLMMYGFKNRQKVFGQILVVVGICLWTLCGLIGLGTGT